MPAPVLRIGGMLELLQNVIQRLKDVWSGMTLNQKVVSGTIIAALFGVTFFLTTLTGGVTEYTLLFAELDARSASEITAQLDRDNIPYKITRGGTAIEVPANRADRLKIDLVAQGLPGSGVMGYDLLDTIGFGISDALQDVQIKRALMGEIRKTLRAFDEIEDAHVQLFLPKPSLFTETAQKPTAAVSLKLRRNRTLPQKKVQTITNIVGYSTGIDPSDVTVADMGSGTLLTKPAMDDFAMQSSNNMEMKAQVDRYYADKIKSQLDGAFGFGISIVSVNTELDFDQIQRTTTAFDTDSSTIRSEEREEITNPDADGGGEERSLTNYETGSTVENFISSPGTIKKLTASVMIDAKDSVAVDDDGTRQVTKIPWSPDELAQINTFCENAVGYDAGRGDRIFVVSMPFGTREFEAEAGEGMALGTTLVEGVQAVSTGVAILAGLIAFFIILRQITRTLEPSKMRLEIDALLEKEKREIIEEKEPESEKANLMSKIIAKATQDPEITAKTIRTIYRDAL